LVGLDVLLEWENDAVSGKRVGLVANPTSVNKNLIHSVFLLKECCNLTTLFGPEHGIWGNAQDMEGVEHTRIDSISGLPVFSLYGKEESSLAPTKDMLKNVDVLVFDIQDIGSRYYTFIYTMALCMQAAARFGKEIVICDRPNPIGGVLVEGNGVKEAYRSFVGMYSLANRHGMTAGELALFFNEEIGSELRVIKMPSWERDQQINTRGWVMPSPNMPTLDTALVYPGMCFLEGTNISEGRGTTRPFEYFGAPFISPYSLVDKLNSLELPGVIFRAAFFEPTFQKWAGKLCGGAQIHITDRHVYKPVLTGLAVVKTIRNEYPEFAWRTEKYEFRDDVPAFDLLAGGSETRNMLESGASLEEIEASWDLEKKVFLKVRGKFLLY